MPEPVEIVRAALAAAGVAGELRRFTEPIPTAAAAAAALDCPVAAIVNSLVFAADGEPLLVLTSGANRVDTARVAALVGAAKVRRADPGFVLEATGQEVGGVAPAGHPHAVHTLIDEDLGRHDVVWAGGGDDFHMWPTTLAELVRLTGGTEAAVRRDEER